jgi:YfiH family protein
MTRMLLRSTLLGPVPHGFSTREGGVSVGRYASLNLSAKWGDDAAAVSENRRRFANASGFDWSALRTARQVHGVRVVAVRANDPPDAVATLEADALIASDEGVVLGVYTADCVPILISDGAGRVAAIHAGWRGTVAEVAREAVAALLSAGADAKRLRAAIGPSICASSFEVGEEVAREFEERWPTTVTRLTRSSLDRPHVDLRAANRLQLEAAGLLRIHIDCAAPCTHCDGVRFFSYRRDGGKIGQQLSFIAAGLPDSRD